MRGIVGMGVGAGLLAAGIVIGGTDWSAAREPAPAPAAAAPAGPRVEYTGGDRGMDFSMSEKPELAERQPAWMWHETGQLLCNSYATDGMAGVKRYAPQFAGEDGPWLWVHSMAAYCPQHWNDPTTGQY